jgi:hypothetical protein
MNKLTITYKSGKREQYRIYGKPYTKQGYLIFAPERRMYPQDKIVREELIASYEVKEGERK